MSNQYTKDASNAWVSEVNSSSQRLPLLAEFTGVREDVSEYSSITVNVHSDVPSIPAGLIIEWASQEAGSNWDQAEYFEYQPRRAPLELSVKARFFRVRYINSTTTQTEFRLHTVLHKFKQASGEPHAVITPPATSLVVTGEGGFGDLVTAELTPRVQLDWVYGSNADATEESLTGTGVVTYSNAMVHVTSGTNGTSRLTSTRVVRYRPGQGAMFRQTAIFDTPDDTSEQLAGQFSCSSNAFAAGYLGSAFGMLRRHHGVAEVRTLTVTAAATGAETVTVTLNGVVANVPVTAGTVQDNAQEIAEGTFPGWFAEATDDEVVFISRSSGALAGTYSVSSTGTLTGTFVRDAVGAPTQDDFHPQTTWNVDKFDGSGPSGCVIDPLMGNVYKTNLQYLGFGAIILSIEDPLSGRFQIAHILRFANANTETTVSNPTFALGVCVSSTVASKTVQAASMAGFIEGPRIVLGPFRGSDATGTASVATPVISIRNTRIHRNGTSVTNLRDMIPALIAVSGTGTNKSVKATIVVGGTLTDPLWVRYGSTHSIADVDKSATAITGGTTVASILFTAGESKFTSLTSEDIQIPPGSVVSVVMEPIGTAVEYLASISWREDL